MQVSRELPALTIRGDLRTEGGTGESLVKGVLAIELEGELGSITVGGAVTAAGEVSDVVRFVPELAPVLAGLTIEGR